MTCRARVRSRLLLGCALALGCVLALGCSDETDGQTDSPAPTEPASEAAATASGASAPDEGTGADCGPVDTCDASEFCVVTRGALCMPLPPDGQQCPAECTPTEHCCNCPAFACVDTPEECGGSVDCGCIDVAPSLQYCQPDRRICEGQGQSIDVTCINVDFDENPFGDDDPFAQAAAEEAAAEEATAAN